MVRAASAHSSFLDAIRVGMGADLVLVLGAAAHRGRLRVLARAGESDHVPDEVLAPQGSLLARVMAGMHPEKLPHLPLLGTAPGPVRPLGPSLVVRIPGDDHQVSVLVVARSRPKAQFTDRDLARARLIALGITADAPGHDVPLDLSTLGGAGTFRDAFEGAAVGMGLVDSALRYRWVNLPLCTMLGRTREELLAITAVDTVHPDDVDRATTFYDRLRLGEASAARDRLRFRRPDGAGVWAEVGGSVVPGPTQPPLLLLQHFDVTADQVLTDEYAYRATHDTLTALANRSLLRERLQTVLAHGLRRGQTAVAFYLDIDDFKSVNDSYGHAAGDVVLAEVAHRLTSVVRAGDTVARVGGDEFVIAGEASGIAEVASMAHRIDMVLQSSVELKGVQLPLSVSIGAALSNPDDEPDDLLARADEALLRAKALRTHVVVADPPLPLTAAPPSAATGGG